MSDSVAPDPASGGVLEGAARALRAARARLVLGRDAASAFFATLALRLTPEADSDCPTMATDGRRPIYGPASVTGLSPDELLGVLVHEVLHCALAHHARRGDRAPGRWNVACDLAVNPVLLGAGFALPAGRLVPGIGAYAHLPPGKSAEEYFAALADTPSEAGGTAAGGSTPAGAGDGPGAGDDPGGCGSVREPRGLPDAGGGDWPEAVTLARSVGDRELGAFAAEVRAILDSFDGAAVVLDHGAEIRSVREWRTADGPLELDLAGGGGTSHVPVFEWLARREPPPACIVCLTDLETRFPDAAPAVPVLWAVAGDSAREPPFGRRIAVGP